MGSRQDVYRTGTRISCLSERTQCRLHDGAAVLLHERMEALDEKRLRAWQKKLTNIKLLIVDELGYVPFTAIGAELLCELFSRHYEHGSTLVTSNLPFDE